MHRPPVTDGADIATQRVHALQEVAKDPACHPFPTGVTRPQNGEAGHQVAARCAFRLHQERARAIPGGSHGGADPRCAGAHDHHVVLSFHRSLSSWGQRDPWAQGIGQADSRVARVDPVVVVPLWFGAQPVQGPGRAIRAEAVDGTRGFRLDGRLRGEGVRRVDEAIEGERRAAGPPDPPGAVWAAQRLDHPLAEKRLDLGAQRLVRRICPECRVKYEPTPQEASLQQAEAGQTFKLYHGKGCEHCNGIGYRGQLGLFELLIANEEISDLVMKRAPASKIREAGMKNGMRTLRQEGWEKVKAGLTTVSEIVRVTFE